MIGEGHRPPWNYGHWSSFGVWVGKTSTDGILLLVYSGVVLSRKHKFKVTVTEVGDDEENDLEEPEFEVDVKERIAPVLVQTPPSAGQFTKSDFPLYIFASEGNVICTDTEMRSWRKLTQITREKFYQTVSGGNVGAHELPELDKEVYDTEKGEDETKAGLTVPIWKIDVEQDSSGELYLSEILGIHTDDTYAFNQKDEDEDGDGDEDGDEDGDDKKDDPCEPLDGVEGGGDGDAPDGDGDDGDVVGGGGGDGDGDAPDGEGVPC